MNAVRTSLYRIIGLFGLIFTCASIAAVVILAIWIATALPAPGSFLPPLIMILGMFVFGVWLLRWFRIITIREDGISLWRPFSKTVRVRWDDVREIGVGCELPARLKLHLDTTTWRDNAAVYVSSRMLTDEERMRLAHVGRNCISFPYLDQFAPRSGRASRCRAALAQCYPGMLPVGIRTLQPEKGFPFSYVLRNDPTDGVAEETLHFIETPEDYWTI